MAANDGPGGGGASGLDPKQAEALAASMKTAREASASVTSAFEQQLKIILQMKEAMDSVSKNLEAMSGKEAGAMSPETWDKVTKKVKDYKGATTTAEKVTAQIGSTLKSKLVPALTTATAAFSGLLQGFKNLAAITKGVTGFFGSIVKGAFNVGKSILAIPFKLMGSLFNMAQSGGGGNELAAALEEVRDQFGSLKSDSAQTVTSVAKDLDKYNEGGATGFRIFGNLAERIKAVNDLAKGMGNTFEVFQDEIKENGEAIMRYQRGLGLTDEQMGSIASTAMRMGKSITQVENEMTKQALGMSKAFGVNAKVLSKDMGKAMQDLAHFGHLSSKEMAITATFAQKLGVSVDKLTGIMDQTATFDQAAEGMSKLNEQFGTNIDASEMMAAQNPGEKVAMLQKAFKAAGKDISQMTYQERMLIKQNTGLDDSMLNAALSAKGMAVNFNDITKQGDKNEKQVLDQKEAMHELADSIKRLTPSGGGGGGGFLDHIIDGFKRGIQSSPEFIGLMRNINRVLREATMFGVKLGKMFVNLFPGVKDVLGGLKDMFNPARYHKMFEGVLKAFDVFKTGGSGKMEDFMKNIQKVFTDFFNEGAPAGKKVLEGFKKFFNAALAIFGKLGEWIIPKIADAMNSVAEWIRKPKIPNVKGAASGAADAIATPLQGAFDALKDKLWPAIKNMIDALWEKIKDGLLHTKIGKGIIAGALAVVLGPALIQGLAGAASGGLFKKAGEMMVGKKSPADAAGAAAGDAMGAAAAAKGADITASPGKMMEAAIPKKETIQAMQEASKSQVDWGSLTKFLLGIAAVFTIGMVAFNAALSMVKGIDAGEIMKATVVFGAVAAMLIPAGMFIKATSGLGKVDGASLAKVVAAIGVIMLEGLGVFSLGLLAVKKLNASAGDIGKTTLMFLAMVPVFLAAGLLIAEALIVGIVVDKAKKEIITGMIALGIVILAMAATAAIMVGIAKLAGGADKLLKSVQSLDIMANVFMKAGAVIGIATAVGAAIIASSGIGAAVAAAGLAALAAAVAVMAGTTVAVLKSLEEIKEDPSALKQKAEAFASIMTAIADMMGKIQGIIQALDFGFFESSADQAKKLSLVTTMIKTLIDGEDGKGGISGIISKIIEGLKTISPDKIEVAKAFAGVLSAVASLLGTTGQSAAQVQDQSTHWYQSAETDQKMIETATVNAKNYITSVLSSVNPLLDKIQQVISSMGDTSGIKEAGGVIAQILSAVGSMLTALSPDISKFQKEVEQTDAYGNKFKTKEVDAGAIAALSSYMSTVFGAMSTHIPILISSIMSGVGDSLKSLDKNQLNALPAVAAILTTVVNLVSAIQGATKEAPKVDIKDSAGAVINITNQMPDLGKTIEDVGRSAPRLITAMIAVAKLVPGGDFKDKVAMIGTLFDTVIKMISTINDAFSGKIIQWEGGGTMVDNLLISMDQIAVLLVCMNNNPNSNTGSPQTLTTIVEKMKEYGELIQGSKGLTGKMKDLVNLFESLSIVIGALKSPLNSLGSGGGVEAMVGAIASLAKLLGDSTTHIKNVITNTETIATTISGKTQGIASLAKSMTKFFEDVSTLTTAINNVPKVDPKDIWALWDLDGFLMQIPEKLGWLSEDFNNIAASQMNLNIEGMQTTINAVQEMVAKTRALDEALSSLPKFSFPAKLNAIASGMGLGGKFAYTVQSKEVVINVEFTVTMNAGEVERVIVERSNSIIRDRLNASLTTGGTDDGKKVPRVSSTYGATQSTTTAGREAGI